MVREGGVPAPPSSYLGCGGNAEKELNMKATNAIKWTLLCVLALPLLVLAQDAVDPVGTDLPQTTAQYWVLGISAVSALIVTGIKKLVTAVPKWVLPTITPLVGIGLGLAMNKLTSLELTWFDAAQAGALAVFIRETFNQTVTKRLAQDKPPAPAAPTS